MPVRSRTRFCQTQYAGSLCAYLSSSKAPLDPLDDRDCVHCYLTLYYFHSRFPMRPDERCMGSAGPITLHRPGRCSAGHQHRQCSDRSDSCHGASATSVGSANAKQHKVSTHRGVFLGHFVSQASCVPGRVHLSSFPRSLHLFEEGTVLIS